MMWYLIGVALFVGYIANRTIRHIINAIIIFVLKIPLKIFIFLDVYTCHANRSKNELAYPKRVANERPVEKPKPQPIPKIDNGIPDFTEDDLQAFNAWIQNPKNLNKVNATKR